VVLRDRIEELATRLRHALWVAVVPPRRPAEAPEATPAAAPVQEPPSRTEGISDRAKGVLEAMVEGGGTAHIAQAATGKPRVRLGFQEVPPGPGLDETMAALEELLRRRLIQRVGSSPCAEVFRVAESAPRS
jgi:hypothetical protein